VIRGVLKVLDSLAVTLAFIVISASPASPLIALEGPTDLLRGMDVHRALSMTLSLQDVLAWQVSIQGLVLFLSFLLLWHALLSVFGLYLPDRMAQACLRDAADFAMVAFCGGTVIWTVTALTRLPAYTAATISAGLCAAGCLSLAARLVLRGCVRRVNRSARVARHVVIIGTNDRAVEIGARMHINSDWGYRLVGFVDDRWFSRKRLAGYSIVSNFAGFSELLKNQVIDEVVICTPLKSLYDWSSRIFAQCELQGITVAYGSDPFSPTIGKVRVEHIGERPLVAVGGGRVDVVPRMIKRNIDIVVAFLLLVLLTPLMVVVALAIKCGSHGSVFFVQERVGLNKRRFHMFKFRTMTADAEAKLKLLEDRNEVNGPVFKIKRDPRVTTIGRILRRASIDELPQLFNVLKGDMSLVGPRPLSVRDYSGITEDWHRRRLSVRPGITCLWQVGGRNEIPFERWMQLDMEYIDRWCLLLDLKILARTIPAVFSGTGAS
jgi:exopolysaccharide biosynthesis polyprenyl glycosylphosphotransferase